MIMVMTTLSASMWLTWCESPKGFSVNETTTLSYSHKTVECAEHWRKYTILYIPNILYHETLPDQKINSVELR